MRFFPHGNGKKWEYVKKMYITSGFQDIKMAFSVRFERTTCSLGGSRSIQLSYENA